MDKRTWGILTRIIVSVNRAVGRIGRRPVYSDVLILRMYFWCVWHDRPLQWVCQRSSLHRLFRPRQLPSRSQFCRRVKTTRFARLVQEVQRRVSVIDDQQLLMFMDGKALPVSESTTDPDATTGRGNGRFSRGYKLHVLAADNGRIAAFSVRPLNEHEVPVASEHLVPNVPPGTMVLCDGNYDSNELYDHVHAQRAWLFTPLKGKAKSGYRLRHMSQARKEVMRMWEQRPEVCWRIYRPRGAVERVFSAISCLGGGLSPLPAWVRRLERVTRWVTAKVILYNARLQAKRAAS